MVSAHCHLLFDGHEHDVDLEAARMAGVHRWLRLITTFLSLFKVTAFLPWRAAAWRRNLSQALL